jgi:hypothetical protein
MMVCMTPVWHSGLTNREAKDWSDARSLDKSLSRSLGFGFAEELTIHPYLDFPALFMDADQPIWASPSSCC